MNISTDRLHFTKFSIATREFYNFANKYSRNNIFTAKMFRIILNRKTLLYSGLF